MARDYCSLSFSICSTKGIAGNENAAVITPSSSFCLYCINANQVEAVVICGEESIPDEPTHSHEPPGPLPMRLYTALTYVRFWKKSMLAHLFTQLLNDVSIDSESVCRVAPG
jgi:hypothetical protein